MNTKFLQKPTVLLATMLVGGALFLPACTSESTPDATADSTATTPPAATVTQPSASSPSPSAEIENNEARPLADKLADASVGTKVKRALIRDSNLRVFPFRPTVRGGHLILRGDVNTPEQYRRAERIAKQVEGVTALTNRLTMGGQPVTDERLAATEDGSEEPSGEDPSVYHTVRQGDTLWGIARQYRASIEQIRSLNDLRTDNLSPGQRIRVR